jgi:hypothetical protein
MFHMFHTIQRLLGYTGVVGLAIVIVGCQFDPSAPAGSDPQAVKEYINAKFASAAPVALTEGDRWTVYAEPGTIMVQHGYGCAEAPQGAFEDEEGVHYGLRIEEFLEIPAEYGDTATVFLNGWRLEYTGLDDTGNDDNHVLGLGASIFDIQQTPHTLQWQAGGILSDKNGNNAFKWCYYYTVVIWNGINPIHASSTHSDQGAALTFFARNNSGDSTALTDLPGLFEVPRIYRHAILPRGFGMMWEDGDDHHLLQQAFDFGDSVALPDSQDRALLSWISQTIFKDNSTRRDYMAAELVSIMSGLSVGVIQPDFSITPRDKESCPNIGTPTLRREEVVVNNVPFDHAIPMLTGWDIGDVCEDHHVKKIGAWIEDWEYTKQPGATSGTLTYTIASTFTDDGGGGLFGSSSRGTAVPHYKVSILGFNEFDLPDHIIVGGWGVQPTPEVVEVQPTPGVQPTPEVVEVQPTPGVRPILGGQGRRHAQ